MRVGIDRAEEIQKTYLGQYCLRGGACTHGVPQEVQKLAVAGNPVPQELQNLLAPPPPPEGPLLAGAPPPPPRCAT